jgi:cell division protein FtsA
MTSAAWRRARNGMGMMNTGIPWGRGVPPVREDAGEGRLIGALDLGASKIVCLIGRVGEEPDADAATALLGVGAQKPQAGVDGAPLDFNACVRAIRIAVDHAERMAGETISSVVTAYGGPGLRSQRLGAAISLPPGPILPQSVRAAIAASLKMAGGERRTVLHAIPAGYRIDGGPLLNDPRGLEGRTLSAEMILVTAPEAAVAAIADCIGEAGLRVAKVVAAPYAAGLAVLSPEERALGAAVMDCGAAHVGVAAFQNGALILADQSPIGGAALSHDIAQRINAPFAAAERLKIVHGGFAQNAPETIEAARFGPEGRLQGFQMPRAALAEAFAPRLEQMLAAAGAKLEPLSRLEADRPWRAALTGGASLMPGLKEFAQPLLHRPLRLARPFGFGVLDESPGAPAYAVAAGLLRYETERPTEAMAAREAQPETLKPAPAHRLAAPELGPKFAKAWDWLKENF